MLRSKFSSPALKALALAALLPVLPLSAQERASCTRTESSDPPARQIFTCGDTFRFEREPSASLRIIRPSGNPVPRMIELMDGAILIEVSHGSAPPQIRTPHAVATVRGTEYVVDAGTDRTSVFVMEGQVSVRRLGNSAGVILQQGEGVDVGPGDPLVVRRWGTARVTALLARFGR